MENDQLIQDYINQKLSGREVRDFEKRLFSDPSFAIEVQDYRNVQNAIKENERKHLKAMLQDLEVQEGDPQEEPISFTKRYRHIYAAAAIIIFSIIGFQFLDQGPTNQDLYTSFSQPYPNTLQPITRGEETTDALSKAFMAYEAGDYKTASTLFDRILQSNSNPDIFFYKAMSLYNEGKQQEATTALNTLKNKNTNYTPQVYWYSALLALKNDNTQLAREQLDSLSMLNSGYKDAAVKKIKKELKD